MSKKDLPFEERAKGFQKEVEEAALKWKIVMAPQIKIMDVKKKEA